MTAALVLSGGGARGAYEVGVLSYIFGELSTRHRPKIDLVCGTSVGAINGTYLASVLDDPVPGMARLVEIWRELALSQVLGFGFEQARRVHRVVLGGRRGSGLFDPAPMTKMIRRGIDWRKLARNLRAGHPKALTVTATQISTGRPCCFLDRAPHVPLPTGLPRAILLSPAHVMPYHVLASAAIPVVFPPVFIHGDLYCDGGLRLNTPLAPAIHLGADRVLVIGLSAAAGVERPEIARGRFPGLPFLLGKVLDAFLLDHVNFDLEELERVNTILRDGASAFGESFVPSLNAAAEQRGGTPLRLVESLAIRPSRDIGEIAAEHLQRDRAMIRRELGSRLLRMLDVGEGADTADLASYLLFDGSFASELIELGRHDAAARRDELAAFLLA